MATDGRSEVQTGNTVTMERGVYRGIRGTIDSITTDEYGTDVSVLVTSDPGGLLNPRELEMNDVFVHVEPADLA